MDEKNTDPREIKSALSDEELERLLLAQNLDAEDERAVRMVLSGADSAALDASLLQEPPSEISSGGLQSEGAASAQVIAEAAPAGSSEGEVESDDIRNRIGKMKLPEKIKVAMFGNSTARGLLIRDSNRMVQMFVLKNPRLQLKEIEEFSGNPNLSEHILRTIAGNQAWTKSYLVKLKLVTNPKTPQDVSLKWVRYLNQGDIRKLAKSKNVPQSVATVARKRLEEMSK